MRLFEKILYAPVLLPYFVSAAEDVPDPGATILGTDPENIKKLLDRIGNWAFAALLAVGVIYFVLAGWKFLTGSGDTEKTSKAKTMIIYSGIAIGVGLLAKVIVAIVKVVVQTP